MSKNGWYQGDDHFDDDDPIYTIRFWRTFSSDKSICSVPFHILSSTRLWSAASLRVRMSRFGLFETRVTIVKMLPTPSNLRSRATVEPMQYLCNTCCSFPSMYTDFQQPRKAAHVGKEMGVKGTGMWWHRWQQWHRGNPSINSERPRGQVVCSC